MNRCHFCGVEGEWPRICMSTRDMEDFAIYDDTPRGERCFQTLVTGDLGEKGARYVTLNREHIQAERAKNPRR